jgi:predicted lipoprotein
MAASDEVGRVSDPPSGAKTKNVPMAGRSTAVPWAVAVVLVGLALWRFPLIHIVPLAQSSAGSPSAAAFSPAAFAEKFWREKLPPAARHATDAAPVLATLRRDATAAARKYAHQVGLGGTAYYFLRGTGRVVRVTKSDVIVALDGADGAEVALRLGPLFGNTLRDGTGLLNVNDFPGLEEFNALSAELNRLAETDVGPALRQAAQPGATLTFAGCAEAPESVPAGPLLTLVPVEVRAQP